MIDGNDDGTDDEDDDEEEEGKYGFPIFVFSIIHPYKWIWKGGDDDEEENFEKSFITKRNKINIKFHNPDRICILSGPRPHTHFFVVLKIFS